jgi:hypothetical protein
VGAIRALRCTSRADIYNFSFGSPLSEHFGNVICDLIGCAKQHRIGVMDVS